MSKNFCGTCRCLKCRVKRPLYTVALIWLIASAICVWREEIDLLPKCKTVAAISDCAVKEVIVDTIADLFWRDGWAEEVAPAETP